jgi:hypothetical protein
MEFIKRVSDLEKKGMKLKEACKVIGISVD